jgi:hypothetical protein
MCLHADAIMADAPQDQAGRQKTAELEQYVRDLEAQVAHLVCLAGF